MKKIISILCMLSVIAAFCACGQTTGQSADDSAAQDVSVSDAGENGNTEASAAGQLDFSTVDINGDPFTVADLSNAKVVLVNFWEPWCGPCVGEIGDLARLYEEYKDQGFLIIGAYSTEGQDEDVKSVIEKNSVTYPVIKAGGNMSEFMTAYVPTTVFADGTGKIISAEPEIGAHSYDEWKALIEDYLTKA